MPGINDMACEFLRRQSAGKRQNTEYEGEQVCASFHYCLPINVEKRS
jgi:hypothetical protein